MKKVLIVGNGISGLSTALTLLQNGASVTIVSPYVSERSQSVMAAGGINSVLDTSQGDSIEAHVTDTLKGGCFMEDKSAIESLCADAPDIIKYLEDIGIIFSRNPDGSVAQRAFGGQSYNRTSYSGASTGKQIVTALSRAFRSYAAEGLAQVLLNHYFHSALIADGRCFGILAYNSKDDSLIPLYADAVVMATGGQNQLFGKTTGTTSCDGYATGKLFEQGVTLRNLEFIQYHPTTIETPAKRMLITEATRGEGGRLFYLDGSTKVYFMEDKYGPAGNLMPRDIVAKGIYDAPSQVYLDIAFLGEKLIKERLPEVYDLCMEYINLDVTKEPIPVYPSVHFFMGGIRVNNSHRSNIEALYAVGECASKYHGANRLGGNSLLAACHSGRAAAFDILDRLSSLPIPDFSDYIQSETNIFNKAKESKSSFPADMICLLYTSPSPRDRG